MGDSGMNFSSKIFFSLALAFAVFTLAAQAKEPKAPQFYKYAHNDAEYSVMLPEAPRVETIWAESKDVPYLDKWPKEGALGEVATFRRVDVETEDSFDVKITFLKADDAFLKHLTKEKMQAAIKKDFMGVRLDNAKFDFLVNDDNTLKWATLTGFSVDKNNHPFYNAEHYLTGQQSILVVKVQYSVENKIFQDYYKRLSENITYHAL
jgi:hypothetical protein